MGSKKNVSRGKYSLKIIQPKNFKCWKCDKAYKRKAILLHHIHSKHLGYKVHCPMCKRTFISVSACGRHLKSVHNITDSSKFKLKLEKDSTATSTVTTNDLNFNGHKSFPYMANVLSFDKNEQFGKHITAKCDIDVGNVVMTTSAFASIEYLSSVGSSCFECGRAQYDNTIQCPHCINLWFCSAKCCLSRVHHSKCKKIFDQNDCRIVRLVTELIEIALGTAEDIQIFMDFSRGILFANKKSEDCVPQYSRYGEILQLKGYFKEEHQSIARRVVKCITLLPKFSSLNSQEFQRTIFHLAHRHATTIELNAFCEEFSCKKGVSYLFSLYDVLSRFNHSCEPNIKHIIDDDNVLNCKVVRPILKGEQVN